MGDKVISQLLDPVPGHPILLASSSERAPPKVGDVVAERAECTTVCRHRVIRKEAGHDLPQPFALFWDRLVHPLSHVLLDSLELRPHAVATGFSLQRARSAVATGTKSRRVSPGMRTKPSD